MVIIVIPGFKGGKASISEHSNVNKVVFLQVSSGEK
jgi:hypothetical protein